MSERMDFMARLRRGERMTDLCREYGISRKTGHKLARRFEAEGPCGLSDRSRRPHRSPHRTSSCIVEEVVALRRRYPTWGPKKLKQRLHDLQPEVRWPAASTIGVILADEGLTQSRKRRRRAWPTPTPLRSTDGPNELWSIDFKGEFALGNRRYCYPLTVVFPSRVVTIRIELLLGFLPVVQRRSVVTKQHTFVTLALAPSPDPSLSAAPRRVAVALSRRDSIFHARP